jgi:acyl phosphate:glycerol-3-phosphate acyltransferase
VNWALAAVVSFLLGAIPSGLWIGRAVRGIDVREHGSGNLGATNVYRTLGPIWGILVLCLDAAKGVAAVWAARAIVTSGAEQRVAAPGQESTTLLAAGILGMVAAALGHMFTPFAGFRGGKGVATLAGAWATLAPLALAIALCAWILTFALGRVVSLASMVSALVLPVAAALTLGIGDPRFFIAILVAALLVLRHRSNLTRLRRGEERRLDLRGPRSS